MKKFFAILAAVCLFGAMNVFANTWSQSNPGSYDATIVCAPTLTGGTAISLGNFFATGTDDAFTSAPTAQSWALTGPNSTTGASYIFKFNGTTYSATQTGITIAGTNHATNILTGTLTIPDLDALDCDAAVNITFQPTSLQAVVTGAEVFNSTLEVDASI
jgi:hypothetical protein